MIAIIRIKGTIGIRKDIDETLYRMRLRRKYTCVVVNPNENVMGMLKKIKNEVAYGEIKKETFEKLVETRGKLIDKNKKTELKKVSAEIIGGKTYEEANVKPFFRLHPPRKGINSKKHFPEGVLGNNKEKINELIERML